MDTKELLAARISYMIDDLLCDPTITARQRADLVRIRGRFEDYKPGRSVARIARPVVAVGDVASR